MSHCYNCCQWYFKAEHLSLSLSLSLCLSLSLFSLSLLFAWLGWIIGGAVSLCICTTSCLYHHALLHCTVFALWRPLPTIDNLHRLDLREHSTIPPMTWRIAPDSQWFHHQWLQHLQPMISSCCPRKLVPVSPPDTQWPNPMVSIHTWHKHDIVKKIK